MTRSVKKYTQQVVECTIDKLVHGGQGLGTTAEGKRVFAWNALPGERVMVQCNRSKSKYLEGVATQIPQASPDRITPLDEAYLSTSPWQMMTLQAEQAHKQAILAETFTREHIIYNGQLVFHAVDDSQAFGYRNKMEYSFWADDDGLHLALFHRGSHGKRIVPGSSLALPAIDVAANNILAVLQQAGLRGSQLKTVVLRASQRGQVVAAVFVKDESFPDLPQLAGACQGVQVCYSNPKSPASVFTRALYSYGSTSLTDTIRPVPDRPSRSYSKGTETSKDIPVSVLSRTKPSLTVQKSEGRSGPVPISYNVHSFFQVNVPVFEQALGRIVAAVDGRPAIDMYSGVGTIGLAIGGANVLVESDSQNCLMARQNAAGTSAEVIEAPAEQALEHIDGTHVLIVDPPRAGLHTAVVNRIRDQRPPVVVYLSCNPVTQARDIALLQDTYQLESLEGYNFFPRTPHIESLAVLRRN